MANESTSTQSQSQDALTDFGIIGGEWQTPAQRIKWGVHPLDDDTMHSVGLYSKEEIDSTRIDKFARFGRPINIPGRLNPGREYLFFVKPDLHICVPENYKPALQTLLAQSKNEEKKSQNPKTKQDEEQRKSLISDVAKVLNVVSHPVTTAKNFFSDAADAAKKYAKNTMDSVFDTFRWNKDDDQPSKRPSQPSENVCVYQFSNTVDSEYINSMKDDLWINPQLYSNGYFRNLIETHPDVVKQLQYSLDETNPFACILSGTSSGFLSLSSSSAKTLDTARTIFGNTYNYLQDSEASDNAQSFDVEFVDTKHLDVFNFFKAYNEYHIARKSGLVTPPSLDYYSYRRLHNAMGVYKFIVAEDMTTLLYWAYFWGVIPTSYPRDAFSDPSFNDGLTFAINFEAAFIDDLNPTILGNFNYLMGAKLLGKSPSGQEFKKIMNSPNSLKTLKDQLKTRELPIVKKKYSPPFTSNQKDPTSSTPAGSSIIIDGTLANGVLVIPERDDATNKLKKYKFQWYK